MIYINENIGSINVSVKFTDKINLLVGDSGSGKSFLLSLIEEKYSNDDNIHIACFDYKVARNINKDEMIKLAGDNDIVILENADLYMTKDLYQALSNDKCIVIASSKNYLSVPTELSGVYIVDYVDDKISTRRLAIIK